MASVSDRFPVFLIYNVRRATFDEQRLMNLATFDVLPTL